MSSLHTPITEFSLLAINGYLQEQVSLLVEQRLQQIFPGWVEPSNDQSGSGSKMAWSPQSSKWLDEQLTRCWTTSLESKIQQSVQAAIDQLLDDLPKQLVQTLTPQLKTLFKTTLARASIPE